MALETLNGRRQQSVTIRDRKQVRRALHCPATVWRVSSSRCREGRPRQSLKVFLSLRTRNEESRYQGIKNLRTENERGQSFIDREPQMSAECPPLQLIVRTDQHMRGNYTRFRKETLEKLAGTVCSVLTQGQENSHAHLSREEYH